jgi:hypothetical protein
MKDESFWEVHDTLRTTDLNVRYYSTILLRTKNWRLAMDLVISILSPSGAVAALAIWKSSTGIIIWSWLLLIPTVIGIIKPIFKIDELISKLEKTLSGYKLQKSDLENLLIKTKHKNKYDDQLKEEYCEIYARKKILVQEEAIMKEDVKLKLKFEAEILKSYQDNFLPEV